MGSRVHIDRNRLCQENAYEILGDASLWLNDTEREIFLKLRSGAIEKALMPQDIFDYQNVAEIARNIVEKQRFKRAQVALINSPAVLAELLKLAFGDNPDKARQVALNYFGDDPKKAAAAAALVAQAGMTHLQIAGHAIAAQSDRLQSLDRLVQFREASNDRKIKELKKRQRKRADRIEREKSAHQANASVKQNGRARVGLQTLDRVITNRETLRNRIIKDHERRKRKAAKAKRSAINDNAPAREAAAKKAAL